MNWHRAAVFSVAACLLFGCAASRFAECGASLDSEFVGSTPCTALARGFLKIPSNAACECIRWHLTLRASDVAPSRGTYRLVTIHGMVETNGVGFYQSGTKTETTGQWKTTVGRQADPRAIVYQLQATDPHRSLLLARIDENLLHPLTYDGQLIVGNDSWSYTLSRTPKQP